MQTKTAVVATIAVFIGALLLTVAVLVFCINPSARGATERARLLGQGIAMLCAIPLGTIWILWAARVRKEREQAKQSPPPDPDASTGRGEPPLQE